MFYQPPSFLLFCSDGIKASGNVPEHTLQDQTDLVHELWGGLCFNNHLILMVLKFPNTVNTLGQVDL